MKTNLLQSQLHRNASIITVLTKQMCEAKADAKAAQMAASRRHHRATVVKLSAKVSKLAAIQKGIKFDLQAQRLANLVRNSFVGGPDGRRLPKKHGKDDPRFIEWARENDQTEYLLATGANREHLARSIEQARAAA